MRREPTQELQQTDHAINASSCFNVFPRVSRLLSGVVKVAEEIRMLKRMAAVFMLSRHLSGSSLIVLSQRAILIPPNGNPAHAAVQVD